MAVMEGLLGDSDVQKIGPPIRWLDKSIAAVLILVTIFGTIGNSLSFVFFTSETPRNRNSLYFKRVYQVLMFLSFVRITVVF